MSEQSDGIDEAIEATLRVGLTVAGQVAERLAREREEAARHAEAQSEQEARQLQARLDAERAAARASLAPTERREWWANATAEDITEAWQTANAWRDQDPAAAQATDRIASEPHNRYGIDVADLRADPDAVRRALADQSAGRDLTSSALADDVEATAMLRDAAHERVAHTTDADASLQTTGTALHDSAERRQDLADALAAHNVPADAAQARALADLSQARPAAEATASAPGANATAKTRNTAATRAPTRRVDLGR